jgi:hypothetical protein
MQEGKDDDKQFEDYENIRIEAVKELVGFLLKKNG